MSEVIDRELEGIFRTGSRYEEMPEAAPPPALRTALYPHQRKALHWMLQQERGLNIDEALAEASAAGATSPQVFFWVRETSKDGRQVFKNLATNSAVRDAPRLPR